MRVVRWLAIPASVLVIAAVVGVAAAWALAGEQRGERPRGARQERIAASAHFRDGRFQNRLPRVDGPFLVMVGRFFVGGGSPHAAPSAALQVEPRVRAEYATPPRTGLRVTWLGHSTTLVEIGGLRVLTDPMFSERASPFGFAGPGRFFPPPLPIGELPGIDAVVISHDHYDHLDMASVRALATGGTMFVVPLGVGARLEGWGVPPSQITELEWWQSTTVGSLTITSTPSRHFSGRWLNDADATLWSGWAIASSTHRVWYSGDTALLDEMEEIGTRLGPFDLAMIEIGEYDALWPDVHLGPEQAVRASRLVKAYAMLPVHWATFELAMHGWTEPIERVLVAAADEGVRVATPPPGVVVEPALGLPSARWWPNIPWQTVRAHPVFSTGTQELWQRTAPTPH
jgi:L-ascorbate metabolism protein UlaG (beta-lactamase superfamily)